MQTTPGSRPLRLLKPVVLLCVGLLTAQAAVFVWATGPLVVEGAFGVEFGNPPEAPLIGATLEGSPIPIALYNTVAGSNTKVSPLPADLRFTSIGWRHFEPSAISPKLRSSGMRFYLLQTSEGDVAMIAALLPGPCDELAAFLDRSIDQKYQLDGQSVSTTVNSVQWAGALRIWSIGSRLISLTCGKTGYLLYSDPARIRRWGEYLRMKNDSEINRDKFDLLAPVSRLLPGSDNTLSGAFGLLFDVPIPNHQSFPVAQKIAYQGVQLSPPYDKAEYELELANGGYPVRLVGKFKGVDFDLMTKALTSRFGAPFKERRDYVQYNIRGDYLSLQRNQEDTRIVVVHTQIDTAGKTLINRSATRVTEKPQIAHAAEYQHLNGKDETTQR